MYSKPVHTTPHNMFTFASYTRLIQMLDVSYSTCVIIFVFQRHTTMTPTHHISVVPRCSIVSGCPCCFHNIASSCFLNLRFGFAASSQRLFFFEKTTNHTSHIKQCTTVKRVRTTQAATNNNNNTSSNNPLTCWVLLAQ